MTYTQDQLRAIIDEHGLWLRREGGKRANLIGADLSGADLSRADLIGTNLSGADLSRADLSRANLSRANLSRANLSGADLSRADLSRANLSRANLIGTNLSRANLSRANLIGTNLIGADLHAWAQVAFKGHGQSGRMLTAYIQVEGGEAVYQCGCFSGLRVELERYINEDTGQDGSGVEEYRASRTRAMEIVTELLNL